MSDVRRHVLVVAISLVASLVAVGCDRKVAGGSTDGAAVFRAACASCHGENGRPPQAMRDQLGVRDLTGAEFRGKRTKELVVSQVRKGSANGRMPSFQGALTDAQVEAVAAFVLTMEP